MSTDLNAAIPPQAPLGRFDGRVQFDEWVRLSLRAAAAEGWR